MEVCARSKTICTQIHVEASLFQFFPARLQLLALEQGLAKLVKVLESKNLMTLGGVESHSKFMCI